MIKTRMRLLVLDTNVQYANPTPQAFLTALVQRADVVVGGLGYGIDTSDLGALERVHGRFDAIVGQTWMFGEPGAGQYGALVPRDLNDHQAPKVLNLLQIDPHAFPEYQYRACVVPADLVLSTVISPQFRIPDAALTSPEEWFDPQAFFVRNQHLVDERWLMVPHCLGETEFVTVDNTRKKVDVSVLGTKYRFRTKAIEHLRSRRRDLSCVTLDGVVQRMLYYATTRYSVQRRIDITPWFHRRFRRAIAQSRVSVTCDASIGYAVRKFFEIPAFGSVLAARFFPEMAALGFEDGTNCFALREDRLDRIDEIIGLFKSDSREAVRVAKAGQEMVWNHHRAIVRAEQFLTVLEAVLNGTFGGARWRDGSQLLLPRVQPRANLH